MTQRPGPEPGGAGKSYGVGAEWWRASSAQPARPVAAGAETADSIIPFWGLMAFLFILFIAPQKIFPVLEPLRIALLAAAVAVGTHISGRMVRQEPVMIFTSEIWIVAALAIWAIATLPLSYWPGGSVSFLFEVFFKTLIVFWLITNVANTEPRLKIFAWGMTLFALPLAMAGIQNYLSGATITGHGAAGAGRILGYQAPLTTNPNDLALMLNLIIPLTVALFLGSRKFIVRMFCIAAVTLMVTAIVTTFSRAGFLTLGVSFLTYLWILRKRPERVYAIAALVLALVAVPFLPSSYDDRMSTIVSIEADETGSAQTRLRDMIAATRYSINHPLVGSGVGMNTLAMNQTRGKTWTEIHNVYLQFAVELGLPGAVMFVMLLIACIRSANYVQRRCARRRDLSQLFYLAEGIRVSLVAFAVGAMFHPVAYHFYFYLIAGLAVAAKAVFMARPESRMAGAGAQGVNAGGSLGYT